MQELFHKPLSGDPPPPKKNNQYIYSEGTRMQGIFVRKKGTISHARHGAGAHVKESKVPAQGLRSTCAGMLAMHKEIGSVPRPDCTRTWSVVDALHHQNICETRRKRIHTKCVVKHLLGAGLRYNVIWFVKIEDRSFALWSRPSS